MSDGYVDPLDVRVAARSQRKSVGRLTRLVGRCVAIVRRAAPRPFALSVALQVLAAVALAGQVWAVQLVLSAILDASSGTASGWALTGPIVLLAALTAVSSLCTSFQGYLGRYLGERVSQAMSREVLAAATSVPLREFEAPTFYDRLLRVQASASSRPYQVTMGLMSMVGAGAASVAVAATLVRIAPWLLPLLVLGGVPLLLTSRRESRREFDFTVSQTPNQRMRAYLNYVQTDRDAAKEVRAFGLRGPFRRRMDEAYDDYFAALRSHLRRRAQLSTLGNLGTAAFLGLTLALVVSLIAAGRLGVAEAGAAVVAIRMLQGQVQALTGGVQTIFESGLFLDDVDAFLRLGHEVQRDDDSGAPAPDGFTSLRADGVTFRYPGAERDALADVSVEVRRGQVVALVGENGSGKTTLAKLVAGLYEPTSGTVTWDGRDVATMSPSSLRTRVAVIFQDFVRYAFAADENIAVGQEVDDARVRAAAGAAGADRALEALPQGYRTVLSRMFRGGQDLSGGQWQRVAIARAFYRDAPLVILDEPTSALDPRAEHDLFTSLRRVLDGRTALFVSHRFSTVRDADMIYVLDQGRVAESGDHDSLMALGGLYAELFTLQASAFSESRPTP